MKIGKLSESILDRSVFKVLHRNREDILCKLKPGIGYQFLNLKAKGLLASTVNVVEGTAFQVGTLAVPRALNSLACTGAKAVGIMLGLTLPQTLAEPEFRKMMRDIDDACRRENIEVMGGHTQVSSGVTRVIASVTAVGMLMPDMKDLPENFRGNPAVWATKNVLSAKPGQDIVMTKWAGMSGAWLLEQKYHDAFVEKYNSYISDNIRNMKSCFCAAKDAELIHSLGIHSVFDLSESGVFGGLWEVSRGSNTGLYVDLKSIPVKQETVELCDFIDVNPYLIPSMGSLLIATDHGEQLVTTLHRHGVHAAVIGSFTDSNDKVVFNDDEVRYLDPPKGSIIDLYMERND